MSQHDVAIAHDYLTQRGGAEKVVLVLARGFPSAPIFTALYDPDGTYPEFRESHVKTTWLNRLRFLRKHHRAAFPLLAAVVGRAKIPAAVTIMSSSGWAHGFRASGAKVVYCYSPARWLYQSDTYLGASAGLLKRVILTLGTPPLRAWDRRKARSADKYFAISTVVKERVLEAYGIDAEVLPAPHSANPDLPQSPVDTSQLKSHGGAFFLCISRLLPYKNVDVVIDAFKGTNSSLIVVGAGPEERRLRDRLGDNMLMVKNLSDEQVRWLYANCRAVISASYEDYGLTPLEGAAYGKPAIVLRWGGFLDTISEGRTGVFFDRPTSNSIRSAVAEFERREWDRLVIKMHASEFNEEAFVERMRRAVAELE